jgi:hypothetical protein
MNAVDLLAEAERLAAELEAQARGTERGSVAERRLFCARSAAAAWRELVFIDMPDAERERAAAGRAP